MDYIWFWWEIVIVSFYLFVVKIDVVVIDIRVIIDYMGVFNVFLLNKN